MPHVRSVKEAEVAGKRVLVRADFNVPLENGAVMDDARIVAALPTIKLLGERGAAKIILLAHLGRPQGKVVEGLRMAPVAQRLRELIDVPNIELKENLRFDPREEANDESFARELAALGDIFVNEAFSDSHRAHASIVGIPKFLPSFAGLRFEEEMTRIAEALTPPVGALAVIGGAKFETKEPLITKLLAHYSEVLVGGALADDLLRARGYPVGGSLISQVPVPVAIAGDERVSAPADFVVKDVSANAEREAGLSDVREYEGIVDIGSHTAHSWSEKIREATFVVWNGPMGVYEEGFVEGTETLAAAIVSGKCRAVVGGGDTEAALAKFTFDPARVFVSTAGGAMLEFLTDGTLPGIEALKNSN